MMYVWLLGARENFFKFAYGNDELAKLAKQHFLVDQ